MSSPEMICAFSTFLQVFSPRIIANFWTIVDLVLSETPHRIYISFIIPIPNSLSLKIKVYTTTSVLSEKIIIGSNPSAAAFAACGIILKSVSSSEVFKSFLLEVTSSSPSSFISQPLRTIFKFCTSAILWRISLKESENFLCYHRKPKIGQFGSGQSLKLLNQNLQLQIKETMYGIYVIQ